MGEVDGEVKWRYITNFKIDHFVVLLSVKKMLGDFNFPNLKWKEKRYRRHVS